MECTVYTDIKNEKALIEIWGCRLFLTIEKSPLTYLNATFQNYEYEKKSDSWQMVDCHIHRFFNHLCPVTNCIRQTKAIIGIVKLQSSPDNLYQGKKNLSDCVCLSRKCVSQCLNAHFTCLLPPL